MDNKNGLSNNYKSAVINLIVAISFGVVVFGLFAYTIFYKKDILLIEAGSMIVGGCIVAIVALMIQSIESKEALDEYLKHNEPVDTDIKSDKKLSKLGIEAIVGVTAIVISYIMYGLALAVKNNIITLDLLKIVVAVIVFVAIIAIARFFIYSYSKDKERYSKQVKQTDEVK